tara:strand:+ start:234 stop:458 length:225 start_codon:yes stop_codon:yes gene_type:complete
MENDTRTTVQIADASGHTEMELTKAETMDVIAQNKKSMWVFAGNKMVEPAELKQANWADVGTIQIVPDMLGGQI